MMNWEKFFPYERIRPSQREAIEAIIKAYKSGKEHFILEAPTGVGKSGIAMTFARWLTSEGKRSTIITKTKSLQEQYLNEFPELVNLKGKENYECVKMPFCHYNDEVCRILKASGKCIPEAECPYVKRRKEWSYYSEIRITNFAFMSECCETVCSGEKNRTHVTIIDECHNIPEEIISRSKFEISVSKIKEDIVKLWKYVKENSTLQLNVRGAVESLLVLINDIKKDTEDNIFVTNESYLKRFQALFSLFESLKYALEAYNEDVRNNLTKTLGEFDINVETLEEIKQPYEFTALENNFMFYAEKFEILANSVSDNKYVCEVLKDGVILTPLFASSSANYVLFQKGDFHLHMSATIGNIKAYMKELGLDPSKVEYLRLPGVFPKENRPIYYVPIINFSYHNQDEAVEEISEFINSVLDEYEDKKGIIHTTSYDFSKRFFERIDPKHKDRIVFPRNGDISFFIKTKKPAVLISPSVYEGHDFKDDLARFQILTKVQYASLGDLYTRKKADIYPLWYAKEAANKLTQSYGRGIRHENDYCDFFICDKNFQRLYNQDLFPKWFEEAVKKIDLKNH